MAKTVLQIPMSKSLRETAENVAVEYGFSSLQEVLRVFMKKLASREISISFEKTVSLSKKTERRYNRMDKDFAKGKDIYEAEDVDDLVKQLHEDSIS